LHKALSVWQRAVDGVGDFRGSMVVGSEVPVSRELDELEGVETEARTAVDERIGELRTRQTGRDVLEWVAVVEAVVIEKGKILGTREEWVLWRSHLRGALGGGSGMGDVWEGDGAGDYWDDVGSSGYWDDVRPDSVPRVFFKPGCYVARIENWSQSENSQGRPYVTMKTTIIEGGGPAAHPSGSVVEWMVMLDWPSGKSVVAEAVTTVTGVPRDELSGAVVERCLSPDPLTGVSPMAGVHVEVWAKNRKTRKGGDFTDVKILGVVEKDHRLDPTLFPSADGGCQKIRPIPTFYKGYKFRSRLEARWAVFFDNMDIQWDSEPVGYVLSTGEPYLPDFWLPTFNGGMHVEVKREGVDDKDFSKARQLAQDLEGLMWLAEGTPDIKAYPVVCWKEAPGWPCPMERMGIPNYSYAKNTMCYEPGLLALEDDGFERLKKAVYAARSARFGKIA